MKKVPGVVSTQERIEALRAEIQRHNQLYYVDARPEITDRDYDRLMAELRALEEEFPLFATSDSPTRTVGAPLRERRDVRHEIPLQSLDNTYSPDELREFDVRVRKAVAAPVYAVEPKIDGVAVALTYRDGVLALGATRGDGEVGEDVTANVRTIRELPRKIPARGGLARGVLELRGEVYIARARFAELVRKMTEEGEEPFANPRNTAAGTLKLLDSSIVADRGLSIFIHTIANREGGHVALLDGLAELGFPVIPDRERFTEIERLIDRLPDFDARRRSYAFETDGLVVKIDATAQRTELGETSRAPRWAIAYKFEPEAAESKLLAIELQVGRTGVVTPVAKFEPVLISGTTVSSATLHNEDEIRRLDVRVGDRVRVQKAGEIIPQVIGVIPAKRRGKAFAMPKKCPVCGSPIRKREGEVKYRCESAACPATVRARILHFGSRTAMEIDGLGPAIVDALLDAGMVKDPADLYALDAAKLAELPRMAEKSAAILLAAIDRSRGRPLERLINALGIPVVGESTAYDLATAFGSLDALEAATAEDLEKIPDIGEIVARSILDYFAQPGSRALLRRLREAGLGAATASRKAEKAVESPLAGKKIVITGSFEGLSRQQAEEAVRALGGIPQSSVSKKTDLLILGAEPGSKYEKAKELGVAIMDAAEFAGIVKGI